MPPTRPARGLNQSTVHRVARRVVTGPRGRWVRSRSGSCSASPACSPTPTSTTSPPPAQSSFLPADAESTRALDALQHASARRRRGAGGDRLRTPGGLDKGDLERDRADRRRARRARARPARRRSSTPSPANTANDSARWRGSPTGSARSPATAKRRCWCWRSTPRTAARSSTASSRSAATSASTERPGLRAYVTGPGGIAADLERVAEEAGRTLLIATLGLVLILLLVVYRAPILALLPLLVVGAAYLVAIGIAYLLIEAGWITVNAEGTLLLLVLIFGAGTDYSLLLVHRYREELRSGRPRRARRCRRRCARPRRRSPPRPGR